MNLYIMCICASAFGCLLFDGRRGGRMRYREEEVNLFMCDLEDMVLLSI